MKPLVAVTWLVTLVGTLFAVVPNLLSMLIRIREAAVYIRQYSEEILVAGKGIAANSSKAAALEETVSMVPALVSRTQSMERSAAALEHILVKNGGRREQRRQGG